MLLAIDVGNTNITLGVFDGDKLVHTSRLESVRTRTADEYAVFLTQLFRLHDVDAGKIHASIVASVVPPLTEPMVQLVKNAFGHHASVVGPGMRTQMPILAENPREVGADRIVNAVAAFERFKSACIVVDFGTATTFDCVTQKGEYMGGAIAPGIHVSADALFSRAAKLPRIEIAAPQKVIGRNTLTAMQAGIVFGYVGLCDGLVERIRAEMSGGGAAPADFEVPVIATGGLATVIVPHMKTPAEILPDLTLEGLRILHERSER